MLLVEYQQKGTQINKWNDKAHLQRTELGRKSLLEFYLNLEQNQPQLLVFNLPGNI